MATHPKLVLSLLSGAVPGIHRTRVEFDGRGGSIGRSEQSAWILTGPGVSRTHAQVRFLNGMYFIEDASTNGLLLNGVPLARSEPAALGDGDRLRLDNMEIGVALQAAAPPAAAAASFPAEASYGPDATLFAAPPAATPRRWLRRPCRHRLGWQILGWTTCSGWCRCRVALDRCSLPLRWISMTCLELANWTRCGCWILLRLAPYLPPSITAGTTARPVATISIPRARLGRTWHYPRTGT